MDADLVAAAQAVLLLVDPAGSQAGKYAVNVQGSQGVQVGDHNVQHNTFGSAPVPLALSVGGHEDGLVMQWVSLLTDLTA